MARKELREKFVTADMGITGANYVIAETGTIGIATNEGNARLVSTLPRVDNTFKHQCCIGSEIECADRPYSGRRVVTSLGNCPVVYSG